MQAYERVINGEEIGSKHLTASWLDILLEKAFAQIWLEGLMTEDVEEECSGLDKTISSLCEENEKIKAELNCLKDKWWMRQFSSLTGQDMTTLSDAGHSFMLSET